MSLSMPFAIGTRTGRAPFIIPEWRLSPLGRTLRVAGISILVLIPCFWQARIEAGDLASHIYNAWLVLLIKQGRAPGLWIAHQWTNILFDYSLSSLASSFGFAAAQRIAVSVSVLLFFWSTFAVISVLADKRPWFLIPCLAMLTYGVIFYLGSFNYYVALALSFFSLALVWKPTFWRTALALCLLVIAWLGQPLPPLWVASTVAYVELFRRLPPRYRVIQFGVSLFLLFGLREMLMHRFVALWSPKQILYVTGADQVVTFGRPYYYIFFLLLGLWIDLFIK